MLADLNRHDQWLNGRRIASTASKFVALGNFTKAMMGTILGYITFAG